MTSYVLTLSITGDPLSGRRFVGLRVIASGELCSGDEAVTQSSLQ